MSPVSTTNPATPRIGFWTWRYLTSLITPYALKGDWSRESAERVKAREVAVERLYLGTATEADRLLAIDLVMRTSRDRGTLVHLGEPGCISEGCIRTTFLRVREDGKVWCEHHWYERVQAAIAAKQEAA